MAAWLGSGSADADLLTWIADEAGDFSGAQRDGARIHPDSLVILAAIEDETNLAFGQIAVDEYDKTVPLTDGDTSISSEWISGTPNVFGRFFTVDLGLDRAITRVRIRAGATALSQPEYFVRGYRIEVARAATPQIWHSLAEERDNRILNFDTDEDSTWAVFDINGSPAPILGRFVRLTVIRQDRSNWITLGEIEVFGTGYTSKGWIEDVLTSDSEVNIGRVGWRGETPESTALDLRFGLADDSLTGAVLAQAQGTLFQGSEPTPAVRYRVDLSSTSPFSTPSLSRIEVEYDPMLVARRVSGRAEPAVVTKGSRSTFTYTVDLEIQDGDWGADWLLIKGVTLDIGGVRVDGRSLDQDLSLESGFRWNLTGDKEGSIVEFAPSERLSQVSTVEIEATALFLRDQTTLKVAAASREQADRDGYVNWQNGRESPFGTWTVEATGAPPKLVGKVEVTPEPFSPYTEGVASFRFVIGNIRESADVVVELFTLDGRQVKRLVEHGRSREYEIEWDGRDSDGRILQPGLYLYQVRVAGVAGGARRGTIALAY